MDGGDNRTARVTERKGKWSQKVRKQCCEKNVENDKMREIVV